MAQGGKYAKLFEIQSRYYQEGKDLMKEARYRFTSRLPLICAPGVS
ncbi:MAG: hypothetical protein ACLVJ6_06055 [Merdibacter sp.]